MQSRSAVSAIPVFLLTVALTVPSSAQQVTGTPGAPGATTTIDGRYLPNPPPVFRGQISPNADQSKPYWSQVVAPPKGAPNVLLIMTDDVGFSAPSTFGGPAGNRRGPARAVGFRRAQSGRGRRGLGKRIRPRARTPARGGQCERTGLNFVCTASRRSTKTSQALALRSAHRAGLRARGQHAEAAKGGRTHGADGVQVARPLCRAPARWPAR
jgi:hypothetical protein